MLSDFKKYITSFSILFGSVSLTQWLTNLLQIVDDICTQT